MSLLVPRIRPCTFFQFSTWKRPDESSKISSTAEEVKMEIALSLFLPQSNRTGGNGEGGIPQWKFGLALNGVSRVRIKTEHIEVWMETFMWSGKQQEESKTLKKIWNHLSWETMRSKWVYTVQFKLHLVQSFCKNSHIFLLHVHVPLLFFQLLALTTTE